MQSKTAPVVTVALACDFSLVNCLKLRRLFAGVVKPFRCANYRNQMQHVPDRWQMQLDTYIRENSSGEHRDLGTVNFRHHVSIRLADGSYAMFRHAFYLLDPELNEIAVFTEHCGYHFFPLYDSEIELLDSVNTDVGTD